MKIINKRRFIASILEVITILITAIITPIAINYANNFRGYKGIGGEYLIPILGLLFLIIIETIYEERGEKR